MSALGWIIILLILAAILIVLAALFGLTAVAGRLAERFMKRRASWRTSAG